jgi:hypothetical protein
MKRRREGTDFLERRESKNWVDTLEREGEENFEEIWTQSPYILLWRAVRKIHLALNARIFIVIR